MGGPLGACRMLGSVVDSDVAEKPTRKATKQRHPCFKSEVYGPSYPDYTCIGVRQCVVCGVH